MILLDRVRCKPSLAGLLCAGLLALAFLPAWAQESSSAVQAPPTSTSPAAGLQLAPQVPPPPQPAPVAPPALPAPPAGMNVPPPAVSSSGEEPAAIEPGASAFEGEAPEAPPAAVPLPSANTRRVQATSRTGSRRAVNAAAPGAYEATDERFAKLEAQFQQLAAEMAFLRAQLARMGRKPMDLSTASPFGVSSTERKTADAQMYPPPQAGVAPNDGNWNAPRAPVSAKELNAGASLQVGGRTETALVRTIYKLPGAKAEALASFLAENVELDLEVTAGEDGLIVTADREASEAIARLISLMTRRKPAPDSRPAARP